MKLRSLLAIIVLALFGLDASSQHVALKTNLVSDALLNVNAGIEFGLAPRWTLDVTGDLNTWKLSHERRWKHWIVMPEARYWLCDRFQGHFFGLHALGGQFNVGGLKNSINFLGSDFSVLGDHRYQGWTVGAGLAYGYAWALGKHWNLEAEIGIGYAYSRSDKYPCKTCGTVEQKDIDHNYVGPTKAAVNIVYLF